MSKKSMSLSIVFAAAIATAGLAHAQQAETTNIPQRAGEASTMTNGRPNLETSNPTTTSRPANVNTGKRAETSNVPHRAGEASTMTNGRPNLETTNAVTTDKKTSKMGNKADKMGHGGKAAATETSNTPQRPGEASTMTGGAPNAKTTN